MKRRVIFISNYHSEDETRNLNALLADFSRTHSFDVDRIQTNQSSEYSSLVLKTIHDTPLDVAELGTSYTRDFVAMNALRSFQPLELNRIGNEDAFLPNIWDCGVMNQQVWAIPWLSDLRLVFYRRDILSKAGVDEIGAFSTPQKFEQTLSQLKNYGIEVPWAAPTARGLLLIHALSSWIGYHGGKFVDEDSKKMQIDQPEAIAGVVDYFRLYKYLGPNWQDKTESEAGDAFLVNNAAVTISGPWVFPFIQQTPLLAENIGIAAPLGKSFIGGSSLAIWNKTFEEQASLELVEYLTSEEFQDVYPQMIGMLPARRSSLEKHQFINKDIHAVVLDALQNGLEAPVFSLWGLLESRLATSLAKLWNDVLTTPDPNIEVMATRQMKITARRLNLLIEQH